MRSPLAVIVSTVFLCSCATTSQREQGRIASEMLSASKEVLACYDRLTTIPAYSPVYSKLAVSRVPASTTQLNDTELMSDEVLGLTLNWYAENQVCDRKMLQYFVQLDPEIGISAASWIQERTRILQSVLEKRQSYSVINKDVENLKNRERQDVRRWYANLNQRLKRQHEQELADRDQQVQQYKSSIGNVAEVLANAAVVAVGVLAVQQLALAQAQNAYAANYRAYSPVPITQTRCDYFAGSYWCSSY